MSWFDRFRKIEKRASAEDPISAEHWIVQRIAESGQIDTSGDNALRQSTVFACVRVLAETIASLPLYVYERLPEERKEPAREHFLWDLLHASPNDFQTAYEFFEMSVGHQCLRGNSYAYIQRNGRGQILGLIPMHPDKVDPRLKEGGTRELVYDYKDETGQSKTYLASDIWHIKGLSSDGFVGHNPIELNRRTIQLAKAAEDHGVSYFENGARTSGIVQLPGRLKEDAKDRLQRSIETGMTGKNKYKVMVFEQGMDWKSISLSNEDSQYLETRNFQVQDICRIFRVPLMLVAAGDKAPTYASAEQFMLSFVVHTIRPWLVRIEQSINKHLLSAGDRKRYFAKFKVEGLLRGDTKTRYEAYASAIQARWMSANEVRALEDMNPRDGGDEFQNPAIDTVDGSVNNAIPE